MNTTKLHYTIALSLLDGIGPRIAKTLVSQYGEAEAFFNEKKLTNTSIPGFSKKRLKELNKTKALLKADEQVNFILKKGIKTYYFKHDNYPHRLKNCIDAPIILYAKGGFTMNPNRVIAVVGTRQVTNYGKELINQLIMELKPYGIQVVSGLAYGVDVFTHKACLKEGVETVGVLGHGLDRLYPSQHQNVASRMVSTNGGLLTEFITGTNPDRENFPKRNRIVAGMTDATVVIESGSKGGSLITANLANDYSRDVFAFPGNITSEFSAGCNSLIANNKAHLITGAQDIVNMLGWNHQLKTTIQTQLFHDLAPDEKEVVALLKTENEMSIDLLSAKLKKPVSKLSSMLLGLEIQGIVAARPGSKFKLC